LSRAQIDGAVRVADCTRYLAPVIQVGIPADLGA
jgi:hypothetical protein